MSNFTFCCPSCGQNLELDDSMSGELVDCPRCSQTIEVPPHHPSTGAALDWRAIEAAANAKHKRHLMIVKWTTISLLSLLAILVVWQFFRIVPPEQLVLALGGIVGVVVGVLILLILLLWAFLWTVFPVFVYQYLRSIDARLARLNETAVRLGSLPRRADPPSPGGSA